MPNNAEFLHQLDTSNNATDPVTALLNRNIEEYLRAMRNYNRMTIQEQTYGTITVNAGSGTHVIVDNTMTFHRV